MARRVFFSFHYKNDVWRASIVRKSHIVEGTAAAGFQDASLWEEAKKKGDEAIKKMINDALLGTTVTAVLIGSETSNRRWVDYEIEQSINRGNGLLGVHIHMLRDQDRNPSIKGAVPYRLLSAMAPIYDWDSAKFGDWVEAAAYEKGK